MTVFFEGAKVLLSFTFLIDVHEEIMAEGKTMVGVIEGDAVPQLAEYYKKGMFPLDKISKVL